MIISAAVLFKIAGGKPPIVLTGKHHMDCLEMATTINLSYEDTIEGFFTDDFRFLDRYEAKYEAKRCKQIPIYVPNESRALHVRDLV